MSLVDEKKYEQCVSVFPLSSLHINGTAETLFPFVCKQWRRYVLAISPCPFSFLHSILCIFPTMELNQNFPGLFLTSQRFPEAPRSTHDGTSKDCSSPLLQSLSFLHWWPLCWSWGWLERAMGSQQPLVSMGLALRHTVKFPGSFLERKSCLWLGSHSHGM